MVLTPTMNRAHAAAREIEIQLTLSLSHSSTVIISYLLFFSLVELNTHTRR